MAQTTIVSRVVVASGAGAIASILFWMSLFLAGPEALFAGAITLAVAIAWVTRGTRSAWALGERLLIACLIAGQASLLSAAILKVVPVVLERVL